MPPKNPNLPDGISVEDLIAANLSQSEIDALTADDDSADTISVDDSAYDPHEMMGADGTEGDEPVAVVEDSGADADGGDAEPAGEIVVEEGTGDGVVLQDAADAATDAAPDTAGVDAAEADTTGEGGEPAAVDVDALLDLRRPEIRIDTTARQAAEDRINTLRGERAAVIEAFNEGDMTRAELDAKMAEFDKEIGKANAQAEYIDPQVHAQVAEYRDAWHNLVDAHMTANPYLRDPNILAGFDAYLRQVSSDDAFADLPAIDQIEIAHKKLAGDFKRQTGRALPGMTRLAAAGAASAAPASEPAPKANDSGKAKLTRDTSPRPPAPTTLANLPAADDASDPFGNPRISDVMRAIDSGDHARAEAAMAKLTPAEQDALSRMV